MKRLLTLLALIITTTCCAGSPLRATDGPGAAITPAPTTYVIIGDSLGLGAYWPVIEDRVTGHDWIPAAVGSTSVHVQWQPGGSAFEAMRAKVTGRPLAFLAHLGANDTVLQPPPTAVSVYQDIQQLVSALQADYPGSLLYLSDVGQVWTYGDKRQENAEVRAAIERAWRELPSVRQGPMLRDLTPDDGVHFTSAENVQILADRWVAALR